MDHSVVSISDLYLPRVFYTHLYAMPELRLLCLTPNLLEIFVHCVMAYARPIPFFQRRQRTRTTIVLRSQRIYDLQQ